MTRLLIFLALTIGAAQQQLVAAIGCTLSNPAEDLKYLYPEMTTYKEDLVEFPKLKDGAALFKGLRARLGSDLDPAAIFEDLFASHGWSGSWRDGVYNFLHFHTHRHEVLGIARGSVKVAFGGAQGRTLHLKAGDVAILPAGTGHQRMGADGGLLVVGAYPQNSGSYDQPKPCEVEHATAVRNIARVARPGADPVYGPDGPLPGIWR